MSEIAIRVEHLGKQYKLGGKQASYSTFRETLVHAANAPVRWLKGERRPEQNEFWALDDVSFEVKHGEALGIIGRNGAGKSTLLKILSRITSPTRGRVDIYGRVGSLLEVGTGFHPELSGRENIYLNGAILGMSRVEIARKFDEIVDFSGVEKFLDTPVKHYSSGMYVRLAFAVAAHLEPEILVVDEVLAVGDAEFQKKCLGKMGDVAYQGRTVLFVSHNMVAIEVLCNKAIILSNGKLSNYGQTSEMVKFYLGNFENSSILKDGIVKEILTQNIEGNFTSTFRIGEPILIKVKLDLGDSIISNPVIGFGVNSSLGQRLFTVGTYFLNTPIPPLLGNIEIVCEIITPNLSPGIFLVKLAIGDNPFSNFLELENIVRFEIVASDYFGNGKLPNSSQGILIAQSKWKVQNLDEK
jgi:lipopolysaccharide transport system ATP-binding protein